MTIEDEDDLGGLEGVDASVVEAALKQLDNVDLDQARPPPRHS
jgi:hypothetical protein